MEERSYLSECSNVLDARLEHFRNCIYSEAEGTDDKTDTSNIKSILLIGQDKREGQSRQRSDSMILATLDKDQKTISLTSFMRDLYVAIPGYSTTRINAAYAYGGMDLWTRLWKKISE